ncbi:hypothetical protein GCM10023220_55920 [Streptomyces ziwulingensis]|uniref:Uncharacterized protein n=1 Tax=Streptomyces ziwulingensis TaxID=1045501 RepID=A0ABP9CQD6_9ACTN
MSRVNSGRPYLLGKLAVKTVRRGPGRGFTPSLCRGEILGVSGKTPRLFGEREVTPGEHVDGPLVTCVSSTGPALPRPSAEGTEVPVGPRRMRTYVVLADAKDSPSREGFPYRSLPGGPFWTVRS